MNKQENIQFVLNFKGLSFEQTELLFESAKNYDVCVLVFTLDMCYIYNANEEEVKRKIAQNAPFKVMDNYCIDHLKNEQIAKIIYQKSDMSNRYLEFNALGVDKGYGLKWLADYLGIDIKETIAIGDNYNDVEMIKAANLGVCVISANDDVKANAQYVTKLDYDQGAVKEVIEKFVLEEK